MDIIDSKKEYKAPKTKVVEVNVHNSILNDSRDTGSVTFNRYDEDTLDW